MPPVPIQLLEQLAQQHREHEKYYAAAPLRDAETVLRAARALKSLADRWRHTRVRLPDGPVSPYLACNDLNDPIATETQGILYLESGDRPTELVDLQAQLRRIAESSEQLGARLRATMDTTWEMAGRTLEHEALAEFQGERHRIIANDFEAGSETWLAGLLVARAVDLLEAVDLSTTAVRRDLQTAGTYPDYLYSTSALLDRAADLWLASTALVRDSEPRWRHWQAHLQRLMAVPTQREEGSAQSAESAQEQQSPST